MRISRYILRMHVGPFIFGTCAVVFLFFLQFLYKMLRPPVDLLNKGLSYAVIGKLIGYNLAWMVVLAVPMGVLVATLMSYGKLSGSNELTIIKSSGGSAIRAMMPAILSGLAVSVALFFFNDRVLPESNQRAQALLSDIGQLRPMFAVQPGHFTSVQGYSILARGVDREHDVLLDVTVYGQENTTLSVITARRAILRFNADFSRLQMQMFDGEVQRIDRDHLERFNQFSFGEYRVVVPTSGFNFTRSDPSSMGRSDRTMNIAQMQEIVDGARRRSAEAGTRIDSLLRAYVHRLSEPAIDPTPLSRADAARVVLSEFPAIRAQLESEASMRSGEIRQADQYLVEIHKKWSIPAACLVFVFVGAPLGIVVRRGNFGVSAAIALGFFVLYWACLVGGEKFADRGLLSPALGMWMANIIIGTIGLYLTILVSRETIALSGPPEWIRRLLRRRSTT